LGVAVVDHVEPPSTVSATWPVTWSTSTAWLIVTQQSWLSGHEMPEAPLRPAGRVPSCVQAAPGAEETSAAEPAATVPMAMHRRSA
jgi:hypothetical protein